MDSVNIRQTVVSDFEESAGLAGRTWQQNEEAIVRASEIIIHALESGGKLLACGNGGSAADAQHFVAELVGKYLLTRRALPALALTTNTSSLTAIGNDWSFDDVFVRQLDALGRRGDVVACISTSGSSSNVVLAARRARELGATVVALTGVKGQELIDAADIPIVVPSASTPRIQEIHGLIIHAICHAVELALSE